jgi:hypothetical protein
LLLLLLDVDIAKLIEVSSVFGVGKLHRIPIRLRSRLRRCSLVVDSISVECALDCGVGGEDGPLEPRIRGRIRRRRLVNGGTSLLLPSVSAASVIAALGEECARSSVEPSKGTVLADMSKAALEVSSCQTVLESSPVGVALFRSRSLLSCDRCTRICFSKGDLPLGAMSVLELPGKSPAACKGRFSPSVSTI